DRIILRDVDGDDLRHLHLKPPGRPRFRFHGPRDGERRFLCQAVERLKLRIGDASLDDDTLEEPRSVPDDEKPYLPARPFRVEPSVNGYFSAGMAGQIFDCYAMHAFVFTHNLFFCRTDPPQFVDDESGAVVEEMAREEPGALDLLVVDFRKDHIFLEEFRPCD